MRDQRLRWRRARRLTLMLTGLALGASAGALTWRSGDTVRIERGEVIRDDLYVAGTNVQIEGTVQGDLLVAARHASVGGTVRGNLWAAGETVTLNGRVGQSARLAGSVLTVGPAANVGRDLLAAGLGLDLLPGARIGRDLAFGGSQTRLGGVVVRNAYVGAGALHLSGPIGGQARFEMTAGPVRPQDWGRSIAQPDPLAPGLHVSGAGRVNGDLTLRMQERPALPPSTVGGRLDYAPPAVVPEPSRELSTPPAPAGRLALSFLQAFAGIVLAGLLLVWLARAPLRAVTAKLRAAPGASLGYGALAFVGLPLAVTLAVGVVGLLAVALAVLGLGNLGLPTLLSVGALLGWLALLAAQGLAAALLGGWLLHALRPKAEPVPVWSVLLGAVVLAALVQVPVLGGLITLAALLLTLGALWLWWRGPSNKRPRGVPTRQPA